MAVSSFGSAATAGGAQPKQAVFNSSGTFTVPENVTSLEVTAVGAGACGYYSGAYYPGGGGAVVKSIISVEPGQVLPITVGAGGTGGASNGSDGGSTTVGTIFAGGGKKNTNSGDYSYDTSQPGTDLINTDYSETGIARGEGFYVGHRVENSEYMWSGHWSGYTNGDRPLNFWNFETMTAPCAVYRGWSTGTDSGGYYVQPIEFKDKFVIFRYNSDPAVFGQSSMGAIQYVDKSSIVSGGSVTATHCTMPSNIITNQTDIRVYRGSGIVVTDDYIYFATPSNGIIRTADGVTWELVIDYIQNDNKPSYNSTAILWLDNQDRLVMMIPNGTYNSFVWRTDAAKTTWTNTGNRSHGFYLYYLSNAGVYGGFIGGKYNPADNRFKFWAFTASGTSNQKPNGYQLYTYELTEVGGWNYWSSGFPGAQNLGTNIDASQMADIKWDTANKGVLSWGGDVYFFESATGATNATTNWKRLTNVAGSYSYSYITGASSTSYRWFVGMYTSPYYMYAGSFSAGYLGYPGTANSTTYQAVGGSSGGPWTITYSNYYIVGDAIDGMGRGGASGGGINSQSRTALPPGQGSYNYSNSYNYGGNGVAIIRWYE